MDSLDELFNGPSIEPVYLDRSKLERYASCPYKGKHTDDKTPKGEPAQVGSEMHRIVAESLRWECTPDSSPAEYFKEEVAKARPDIQPQVIEAASKIVYQLGRIRPQDILGVEYQIHTKPGIRHQGKEVILTTALDLVRQWQKIIRVDDWKSVRGKLYNVDARLAFQSHFGTDILWDVFPNTDVVEWVYHCTRYGTTAYARFERNAPWGMEGLTQRHAFRARTMQAVRLWMTECEEAWPEPKKCLWCEVAARCPHVKGDAADIAKDPQRFADQYIATQARMKQLKTVAEERIKSGQLHELRGSKFTIEQAHPTGRFSLGVYPNADEPEAEDGDDAAENGKE